MIDLTNQVAIVTGANRGIGLATAKKLCAYGASVTFAVRQKKSAQQWVDQLTEQGMRATVLPCDVRSYEAVKQVVAQTVRTFGRLDILVNNAGVIDPIARIIDSDPKHWTAAINTNLTGVYNGIRAASPIMKAQHGGVIVNLSSGAANSRLEGWSHYCAAKAASKKLTECAHLELSTHGIRVVGLSPGTVATQMMASVRTSGLNPVSRLDWSEHISPDWAAEAVAFLCGPQGSEFSGSDFSIKTAEGRLKVGLPKP